MSLYDKTTNNKPSGSTYQLPNPLNTNQKEEVDWMNVAIITQMVILVLATSVIYLFDIKIFSSRTAERNKRIKESIKSSELANQNVEKLSTLDKSTTTEVTAKKLAHSPSTKHTKTKKEVHESTSEPIKASADAHVKKEHIQVKNSADDIVFELQTAWYKHDHKKIQKILNGSKKEHFSELLHFANTHLLDDGWLTLEQFCKMGMKAYRDNTQAAMDCSEALISQNKLHAALKLFKARPKIRNHTDYYVRIAYLRLETKDYKGAAEIYRKLLDVDGAQPTWYLGLGYALTQLGQSSDALHAYKLAYQHADASADYMSYLEEILSNGSYSA